MPRKDCWSKAEDAKLYRYYSSEGPDGLVRRLVNRSASAIKNRASRLKILFGFGATTVRLRDLLSDLGGEGIHTYTQRVLKVAARLGIRVRRFGKRRLLVVLDRDAARLKAAVAASVQSCPVVGERGSLARLRDAARQMGLTLRTFMRARRGQGQPLEVRCVAMLKLRRLHGTRELLCCPWSVLDASRALRLGRDTPRSKPCPTLTSPSRTHSGVYLPWPPHATPFPRRRRSTPIPGSSTNIAFC